MSLSLDDKKNSSHAHAALSRAYRVREHLLTILLTWSLTDSLFEMAINTKYLDSRYSAYMSGSDDG